MILNEHKQSAQSNENPEQTVLQLRCDKRNVSAGNIPPHSDFLMR